MSVVVHDIDETIKPDKILWEGTEYIIDDLPGECVIRGFKVFVDSETNFVNKVVIGQVHHPNAISFSHPVKPPEDPDPNTEFCIPWWIMIVPFDDIILEGIKQALKVYNFDQCYWKDLNIIKFHENVLLKEEREQLLDTAFDSTDYLNLCFHEGIPDSDKQYLAERIYKEMSNVHFHKGIPCDKEDKKVLKAPKGILKYAREPKEKKEGVEISLKEVINHFVRKAKIAYYTVAITWMDNQKKPKNKRSLVKDLKDRGAKL